MNTSFLEFLKTQQADSATIQEAAIIYLGEITDDLPPEEMREEVAEAAGDSSLVETALEELRHDSKLTEQILISMFSGKWEEQGEPERIQRAFEGARHKLPVIETIVIGCVTLYAMYLNAYSSLPPGTPPPKSPSDALGLDSLWKALSRISKGE
jgi:hypothetical protein